MNDDLIEKWEEDRKNAIEWSERAHKLIVKVLQGHFGLLLHEYRKLEVRELELQREVSRLQHELAEANKQMAERVSAD